MSGKKFSPSQLIAAIRSGSLLAVSKALADGADIEEADIHGQPGLPLRTACFSGNPEIVSELIQRGADINAPGSDGPGMPLRLALRTQQQDVIALLIKHGAEIPPDVMIIPQLPNESAPPEPLPPAAPVPELAVASSAEPETERFGIIEEIGNPASAGTETNLLAMELLRFNEDEATVAAKPSGNRVS